MPRLAFAMVVLALVGCGRLSFDSSSDGPIGDGITGDGGAVANRIFVTQATTRGNFGGVANADLVCANEAQAAGLSGTFIAFVSDATTTALDRLEGSRGWVRVDGTPVGDLPAQMIGAIEVFNPINQTANGTVLVNTSTWTGSDGRGVPGADCVGWTSNAANQMGEGNAVLNGTFAGGNPQPCDQMRRFACLEIGRVAVVAPRPVAGRIAFVTAAVRPGDVGRAAADALCNTEATAAGLPGTYLAALALTTTTITSRFTIDSRPWVRVDGTRIATPNTMLTGTGAYDSFVSQYADGTYNNVGFWTGVTSLPDATSVVTDTCTNWTATTGMGVRGAMATANRSTVWSNSSDACSGTNHLLCMQE